MSLLPILNKRLIVILLGFSAFLLPQTSYSANTEVQLRLTTPLTSFNSKVGDSFECVVLSPWVYNERVVIPEGATVRGHVGKVTSVGLGIRHERARLDLVFDNFVTEDGQTYPIRGRLASIDNSREQVTSQGYVRGVLAAKQPNELIFGVWHSPSVTMLSRTLIGLTGLSHQIWSALSLGPAGAGGMLALRLAIFRFPEPEIAYAPGTDMRIEVNPAVQDGVAEIPAVPLAAPDGVSQWLRQEPFGIDRRDGRPVADIVNVAFLGSREQLTHAFAAAGWSQADPRTRKTVSQAYSAFNSMRAYAAAPVSNLLYKGMLPELVFEKSLNTITKRHHIRVWYAGVVDGQELWLGAATHDTGASFSVRSFRFTHKVDANIDDERDKVKTDLRFAGCVEPDMRVDRQLEPSQIAERGTITDGAATVLSLKDCQANDTPFVMPKPGNMTTRMVRRMILEARNHIVRENPYYWTFEFVKRSRKRSSQP